MASPFSVFRKNQKIMMAILAVMAMLAFTVLEPLMQLISTISGGQNPVVARSRFGEIRDMELQALRSDRQIVKNFFMGLRVREILKSFGGDFSQLSPQLLSMFEARIVDEIERQFGPTTERAVVESSLLADQASKMGIVIGDDYITAHINRSGGSSLQATDLDELLATLPPGIQQRPVTWSRLYDAIRRELLARQIRNQFFSGLVHTPGARWDYYQQTKARAKVELVAVPVRDFVAQAPEPTPQQVTAFYNEFKERLPEPGSPEPGFKVPHRAAFQYVRADMEHFIAAQTVTSEEVEEYYDKNKDSQFLFSGMGQPSTSEEPSEPDTGESTKPDDNASELPAADSPGTPDMKQPGAATETPAEPKTPETPAADKPETDKPEADKPAAGSAKPSAPQDEKPAETGDEPAKESSPPAPATEKSDNERPSSDSPASDDANNDDADSCSAGDEVVAEGPGTETADQSPGSNDAPADAAAVTETPAETAAPVGDEPATPALATPSGDELPKSQAPPLPATWAFELPRDIAGGIDPRYDPLWKVEEQIRKTLARQKADQQIRDLFSDVRDALQSHVDNAPDNKPSPLTLDPLIKDTGLTADTTPLLSAYDLSQVEGLGTSVVDGNLPFTRFAFEQFGTWRSALSVDSDNNQYLFWKIEDSPAHVPALDDIRADIVRVWKMREAVKLAQEQASALASKARSESKPLADVFQADDQIRVFSPPRFSWLSTGTTGSIHTQTMPELTQVEGVEDPGPEFMRTVFSLQPGEIGVAMNNPRTVAYVIRVTEVDPTPFQLREGFLADGTTEYRAAAQHDVFRIFEEWQKSINEEARLVWLREPVEQFR